MSADGLTGFDQFWFRRGVLFQFVAPESTKIEEPDNKTIGQQQQIGAKIGRWKINACQTCLISSGIHAPVAKIIKNSASVFASKRRSLR